MLSKPSLSSVLLQHHISHPASTTIKYIIRLHKYRAFRDPEPPIFTIVVLQKILYPSAGRVGLSSLSDYWTFVINIPILGASD